MIKPLLNSFFLTLIITLVTGVLFPGMLSAASNVLFPFNSQGSLIKGADGQIIGSSLIGQRFAQAKYFHPRPSAAGAGYAAEASSGTNLCPSSAKLIMGSKDFSSVKQLADDYRKENVLAADAAVPVDAVTRSASGLDPDISPANALLQVKRVASSRGLTEASVIDLVKRNVKQRELGVLGEPRVNVLLLNLELDRLKVN
jgi:K+-transporting ATPase ATPase C chain